MTAAAPDLLARLNAAGVTASVKLRLDPRPGVTIPSDLMAEANAARPELLARLVDPLPAPRHPDLRGVLLCLDDAGACPWVDGKPHPDAGPRLLSVLRDRWPAEVTRELTRGHADDLLRMDAEAAFARLWCRSLDVTRADRTPPP